MLAFLTSCNRHDLLKRTLDSLPAGRISKLIIHEDSNVGIDLKKELDRVCKNWSIKYLGGVGQIESIKLFLDEYIDKVSFYLHLEDDWEFDNTHDCITDMIKAAAFDIDLFSEIVCNSVQIRGFGENVHNYKEYKRYNLILPTEFYGNVWNGFSWNPSLIEIEAFRGIDYNQTERIIDDQLSKKGFKSFYLPYKFYTHIGNDQSTRQ